MAKQAKSVNKVVASSGNVFADLGLPDAAELDTKVRLPVWGKWAAGTPPSTAGGPSHCAIHQSAQDFRAQTLQARGVFSRTADDFSNSPRQRYRNPRSFAETIFLARKNFGQCRLSGSQLSH